MEWLYARGIPIEAQFLYRKALDLSGRGDDESALRYLMQAVVIAPRYARAFFEMGNCLARLGRFREAREKYDRAAHIDPGLSGNGKNGMAERPGAGTEGTQKKR
jgi:tetratricopeptide (TPR) repeat protein